MVAPGSKILQYKAKGEDNQPVIIFLTPENQYLVVAGNFNGKQQNLSVKLAGKNLEGEMPPHSLNKIYLKRTHGINLVKLKSIVGIGGFFQWVKKMVNFIFTPFYRIKFLF